MRGLTKPPYSTEVQECKCIIYTFRVLDTKTVHGTGTVHGTAQVLFTAQVHWILEF